MHAESIMKKLRVRQWSELARSYDRRAFVLWLADEVGTASAEELVQAIAGWIREHLRRLSPRGTVRVIYGPDDKLLAEVPIFENGRDE